jgi:hypothetical protein
MVYITYKKNKKKYRRRRRREDAKSTHVLHYPITRRETDCDLRGEADHGGDGALEVFEAHVAPVAIETECIAHNKL